MSESEMPVWVWLPAQSQPARFTVVAKKTLEVIFLGLV